MLIENPFNESSLAFPVLEYLHIAGFACGVGTIALLNFRQLGVGLTRKSAGQLWSDTMPWTLGGLSLVIFSGLLLFSINPDVYYLNYTFLLKMSFLLVAILFHYTIVRKAAVTGWSAGKSRTVASVSLALWMFVLFGGIFIGLSATRPPAAAPPPAGFNFDDFLSGTPHGTGATPATPPHNE
jgi:predicted ferric reductase